MSGFLKEIRVGMITTRLHLRTTNAKWARPQPDCRKARKLIHAFDFIVGTSVNQHFTDNLSRCDLISQNMTVSEDSLPGS